MHDVRREYRDRFYRQWVRDDTFTRFEISIGESDLLVLCSGDRQESAILESEARSDGHRDERGEVRSAVRPDLEALARETLVRTRNDLTAYIARDPRFLQALIPWPIHFHAPLIVRAMAAAAHEWDVGPMAAVAGAVAQAVAVPLLRRAETVIVENGGDLFIRAPEPVTVGIYAGDGSPFRNRLAIRVDASDGLGICTSSGTVGPSLSFGRADAVVAIALDAARADAAATAIANRIRRPEDIDRIFSGDVPVGHQASVGMDPGTAALTALLACCGDRLGVQGAIELV